VCSSTRVVRKGRAGSAVQGAWVGGLAGGHAGLLQRGWPRCSQQPFVPEAFCRGSSASAGRLLACTRGAGHVQQSLQQARAARRSDRLAKGLLFAALPQQEQLGWKGRLGRRGRAPGRIVQVEGAAQLHSAAMCACGILPRVQPSAPGQPRTPLASTSRFFPGAQPKRACHVTHTSCWCRWASVQQQGRRTWALAQPQSVVL
jgi:hypothetical protein